MTYESFIRKAKYLYAYYKTRELSILKKTQALQEEEQKDGENGNVILFCCLLRRNNFWFSSKRREEKGETVIMHKL